MENFQNNSQSKCVDTQQKDDENSKNEISQGSIEKLHENDFANKENLPNKDLFKISVTRKGQGIIYNESENDQKRFDESDSSKGKSDKEKKDESSSSTSSSRSSSDDESETSSEEKTEPSNLEPNELCSPQNVDKHQAESKTEDTTDDSDIEDDLISAINYNTITSLAALKDMLQSSGEDSDGVDSFFHHYFLSHVNRLPSRNQTHSPYPWGRRLSECREEDEYETEEGNNNVIIKVLYIIYEFLYYFLAKNCENRDNLTKNYEKNQSVQTQDSEDKSESIQSKAASSSSSEKSSSERIDQKSNQNSSASESRSAASTSLSKLINNTVTSPTSSKPLIRRRNTTGPGMVFPATDPPSYSNSMTFSRTSPLPSPHLDKKFFDSSLVEMKSQASSSSTLDYDSTEEIWVRRIDFVQERKKRVSYFNIFSN